MNVENADLSARDTYEAFAPAYDVFNHAYQYELWTGKLLAQAQEHGLSGDRLLDVGCGTGLSFIPMLERGWRVTACDISPAMLAAARVKVDDAAELFVADMRELPALVPFDLVWAVNDAVNYLLDESELRLALAAMAANLAPNGVLLFDLNTQLAFETFFRGVHVREVGERRFIWRGQAASEPVTPGTVHEARFEAAGEEIDHTHRQRHFLHAEVLAAIEDAGLRSLAVLGEREGDLERELDERRHTKAVYLCAAS